MPLPKITFNKDIKAEDRTLALQKMEDWCKTTEVSKLKGQILQMVIEYAKKNLLHIGLIDFNYRYNPNDFEICNAIFQNADLPDVLFMQDVINQFKVQKEINNELEAVHAAA